MVWVMLIAAQLAAFQDVWFIVLIPPLTLAVLGVNLAVLGLFVKWPGLENRLVGMLLGVVVAAVVTTLPLNPHGLRLAENLGGELQRVAGTFSDPGGIPAAALRFIAAKRFWIAALLADLIGIAIVWRGGELESRIRAGRGRPRLRHPQVRPLDAPAPSPL
jgi:hypothetical protein